MISIIKQFKALGSQLLLPTFVTDGTGADLIRLDVLAHYRITSHDMARHGIALHGTVGRLHSESVDKSMHEFQQVGAELHTPSFELASFRPAPKRSRKNKKHVMATKKAAVATVPDMDGEEEEENAGSSKGRVVRVLKRKGREGSSSGAGDGDEPVEVVVRVPRGMRKVVGKFKAKIVK